VHVVLAGGGTAGHIEPALALADALRRQDPTVGITALGTERGLETRLVPERGYELALIPAVPLPRRPTPELITVPGRLRGTIKAAEQVLERTKASCLIGFGGYVALPGYLAAKRLGVPIVVHEANARPGLANKIGSRYAHAVAVSTPDSKLRDARYIGIPLRRSIATLDRVAVRPQARAAFGLDPNLPTLLVSGGSQGARRLNETIQAIAPRLQRSGVQVLHAVGPNCRSRRTCPACRSTSRCPTWTGWTWPTPPPT
jgi:UDP-N-acetylglucosamine--N-acetylmuramyl-(pentapeptide) pyrophosphoryl-undecaprenol N-acetylglucosamine transferase